jgi:hypothetical protein
MQADLIVELFVTIVELTLVLRQPDDRDINAAINIKKFALMGHEVEPVDLEKTVTSKYEAGCPSLQ